jgi:HSP20 family protein
MAEKQANNQQVTRQQQRGGGLSTREAWQPFSMSPAEFFNNPFGVMRRMHEQMDRIFSDAMGGAGGSSSAGGGMASFWSPAIEVSRKDNEMVICAELPGLKPDDVKIEMTDEALVIQGERKQENQRNEGGAVHSERSYGRFYRTIPLPDGAQTENARADFKDGELVVHVPVHEPQSKSRQIPINGGAQSK